MRFTFDELRSEPLPGQCRSYLRLNGQRFRCTQVKDHPGHHCSYSDNDKLFSWHNKKGH